MIKIGLAGDVMIGRRVNEYLDEAPPHAIWGDVLPLLHSADLNLINLETPLTKSEEKVSKVFNFKADPEKVETLASASIHAVNLANNHVLDFSEAGLLETLKTLKKAHIQYVGAGEDEEEAKRPLIIERKGIKIGIIGCTDNEPSWSATPNRPGTFYLEVGDIGAIRDIIAKLRPSVDILLLTVHWGPNLQERPSLAFQEFAHRLIDLGVDIIHGHSAHIFQGVEIYKGKCILYDTGDFVDDYFVDPELRNDCSFLFLIEAEKTGLRQIKFVPTCIKKFQVKQAKGEDLEESLRRMQLLSEEMHTHLIRENSHLIATL